MPKRVMRGVVVSAAPKQTVVVRVERLVRHPLYKKFIRRSAKYHAHDPDNACQPGDVVRIRETRPMSKLKCWEVLPTDAN
ncbi:MAG: 30S ribosomal protein S17 [Rhodospirillales bacterium]|nr:30S ribosomal protein S17 [Rhodospirillales bacterium]MCY4004729.1 30S ribosomal protein S17 [Rhodospirillales bacterium]MCY4098217.1 30S ribosomal protein S17 [Rhodospirillales bacterium]MDE0373866.1 30S ribosomal protein S17 [Rhodospirillales bacterium]MXX22900.1 30S ribosomal protein S17 [Rhodospirillales bacterium]